MKEETNNKITIKEVRKNKKTKKQKVYKIEELKEVNYKAYKKHFDYFLKNNIELQNKNFKEVEKIFIKVCNFIYEPIFTKKGTFINSFEKNQNYYKTNFERIKVLLLQDLEKIQKDYKNKEDITSDILHETFNGIKFKQNYINVLKYKFINNTLNLIIEVCNIGLEDFKKYNISIPLNS